MKRKTIRNHNDFFVPQTDLMAVSDYFLVKAKNAKIPCDARYGIITSKKTFKLAVQRNRAKRLMRDWIAFNENLMNDNLDYIFIPRSAILGAQRQDGREKLEKALNKILKTYEQNTKKSS